ncbi:MAG: class I SAM-dependent methyltransferase, partial [Alphaproteobacteria bacterium]|nr:class I SAM-dependent methyltransferase [Alphaproteobacteria bacterium]
MTTKLLTGLLAKAGEPNAAARCTRGERLFRTAFGAIQWPWLLRSLYGGTQAQKQALLARVGLAEDALPHLGSWKAD